MNPTVGMSGGYMLQGLPQNVYGGQPYQLTMVAYRNNAICQTAGFQMNVLNNDGTSHGQFAESDLYVTVAQFGNMLYSQSASNPSFGSDHFADTIYFPFTWTPENVNVATSVKASFGVALGNGNFDITGGQRGDSIYMGMQDVNVVPLLVAEILVLSRPLCNGETGGSIEVSYSGGQPPINVMWSTGDNGPLLNDQPAGMYSATVTDAVGQQVMLSAEITEPTSLSGQVLTTNPTCHNTQDGSNTLNVFGGTPPYTYFLDGQPSTDPVFNLGPGTYQHSVVDMNGCEDGVEIVLVSPEPILIDLIDIVPQTTQMGGAIVIELSGGTLPYDYFWEGPGDYTTTIQNPFNLMAGLYNLTVTDGNGCTEAFSAQVDFASGIRDLSNGYTAQLTPNPGRDLIRVELPVALEDEWQLRCINAQGEMVHDKTIISDVNGVTEIRQNWIPGLYVITCYGKSSGVVLVTKWVKSAD
jgi:hypothetical protein